MTFNQAMVVENLLSIDDRTALLERMQEIAEPSQPLTDALRAIHGLDPLSLEDAQAIARSWASPTTTAIPQ
jgi:hypothetical protein